MSNTDFVKTYFILYYCGIITSEALKISVEIFNLNIVVLLNPMANVANFKKKMMKTHINKNKIMAITERHNYQNLYNI